MEVPKSISLFCELLEQNGYRAFLVGGCVRDMLMHEPPHDYDITTNARPEELLAVFRKSGLRAVKIGGVCGTVSVSDGQQSAEITPFRRESGYTDFRRPDDVTFVDDVDEDLSRRDFTMNAMALSKAGDLTDRFGGKEDIANKMLRCVGNPYDRFREDPLRILRAMRFLARFSFHAEAHTKTAMISLSHLLKLLSAERIFSELKLLLETPAPLSVIAEFIDVLKVILPGFIPYERLDFLPNNSLLRLFCLLYRCPSDLYRNTVLSLKPSTSEKEFLFGLYSLQNESINPLAFLFFTVPARHALRRYGEEMVERYLDFLELDKTAFTRYRSNGVWKLSQLAVSGSDFLLLGMEGAKIGTALSLLLCAVIEEKVQNEKETLVSFLKGNNLC